MGRRYLMTVVPAILLFTATGCAAGLQQRLDEQQAAMMAMQERLDQIARQNDGQGQELEAVRRDMQQIGAKITQTEEQMADLTNRTENLSTRVSLLTDDVSRRGGTGTPPGGSALRFQEGPAPMIPTSELQSLYDNALRLYEVDSPAQARQAIGEFAKVMEMYGDSDLADNAQYWTGECYYKLEEWPASLQAFQRVFNFRFTDKYDDAQLKIGMTYRKMGQTDNAIAAFRELLQKYPDSPYTGIARRHLAELGG